MMLDERSADTGEGSTITTAVILSSGSVWTQDGAVKIDAPYHGGRVLSSLLFPPVSVTSMLTASTSSSYIHRSKGE
jgi:hypothetical protein